MGRYLYELINEKKELQLKLDNYNNMLDKNFGSEKYFAIKNKHYKAMNELREKIKKLTEKINFMMNLKGNMDKRKWKVN